MRRLLYYTLFICAALLVACSEEDFKTFNGEVSGIYLQRDGSWTQDMVFGGRLDQTYYDSLNYSFLTAGDLTQTTQNLPVKIMGNVTDYDRPFVITVDESQTTAQRGVHYDFNESDCVIKAGTAETNVPITLYRHSDLLKGYYYIMFQVESNEYFTTELDEYKNSSNWQVDSDVFSGRRFKFIISEVYTEPSYWDTGYDTLGDWSASKEQRVNNLMGWTHSDWLSGGFSYSPVQYGRLSYAAKLLRKELQALADAGTPVVDDNGSYMQLAAGYEVDYSAYE